MLGIGLALLPLFDRRPERRLRRRPVVAALGLTFFLGFLGLWVAGRALRSTAPSADIEPAALEQGVAPVGPGVVVPAPGPEPVRPGERP